MSVTEAPPLSTSTNRFYEKRERIIYAATHLINAHGVKGMTFVDVAKLVDLNTTSVTYYFKRKEQLAAAVMHRSIEQLENLLAQSETAPSAREKVANYIGASFDLHARIRRQECPPMAHLSDIRTLEDPYRKELSNRYIDFFRRLRAFFGDTSDDRLKALNVARTHALVESMFWLPAWVTQYSISDFTRLTDRMFSVFDKGVAFDSSGWDPILLNPADSSETHPGDMTNAFLRAATHLINERGYRGASVNRIADKLNVTKGSFYHHLDKKDDLVIECFRMSYSCVSRTQLRALEMEGDYWLRLSSSMATLIDIQFNSDFPLLRTTALHALPTDIRSTIIERSNRVARRFAGMLVDGIAEGSVRAVDPFIASQMMMSTLNGAYELRRWAGPLPRDDASRMYASTISFGLFADI
ncbi:TetR/AcrR family transcriptional regulator [Hyphococcus flavus]|uniref:TetR/AcrR family transcriptional regulator n=1 Tax=Hyphococcus flavus TaxID=1866326 RepID=A0AAF0CB77_9PROT|nr:TetR/AcrR family transcriptional regulator [Hyphococcus flavus]WDI30175.1 TetR/AcrR family transcriptional regulator [Hyphococcus flavus]